MKDCVLSKLCERQPTSTFIVSKALCAHTKELLIDLILAVHVEQFKKSLTQEIAQHSNQLTQMQEQKNALELVISDLFAIKAKHTSEPAIVSVPASIEWVSNR